VTVVDKGHWGRGGGEFTLSADERDRIANYVHRANYVHNQLPSMFSFAALKGSQPTMVGGSPNAGVQLPKVHWLLWQLMA
jgi:hypothetical protein